MPRDLRQTEPQNLFAGSLDDQQQNRCPATRIKDFPACIRLAGPRQYAKDRSRFLGGSPRVDAGRGPCVGSYGYAWAQCHLRQHETSRSRKGSCAIAGRRAFDLPTPRCRRIRWKEDRSVASLYHRSGFGGAPSSSNANTRAGGSNASGSGVLVYFCLR